MEPNLYRFLLDFCAFAVGKLDTISNANLVLIAKF